MKHIYIVMGSQGSYSDFHEWAVCAYIKEWKASAHVAKAQARALEIQKEIAKAYNLTNKDFWVKMKSIDQHNRYDTEESPDHTTDEVNYYLWTVEIVDGRKAL
jgi:hypothetical protein